MTATTFRRVSTLSEGFVQLPNELVRDPDLSWKAKAILACLLSNRHDYEETMTGLEGKARDGSSALRTGIEELEAAGYLRRERIHGEAGRFTYVWEYSDHPVFLEEEPAREPEQPALLAVDDPAPAPEPETALEPTADDIDLSLAGRKRLVRAAFKDRLAELIELELTEQAPDLRVAFAAALSEVDDYVTEDGPRSLRDPDDPAAEWHKAATGMRTDVVWQAAEAWHGDPSALETSVTSTYRLIARRDAGAHTADLVVKGLHDAMSYPNDDPVRYALAVVRGTLNGR